MDETGVNLTAGAGLPIAEDVRRLQAALGTTLVAALAGTREVQRVQDWARHDGPNPSEAERERILVARRIWRALADAEGEQVARFWFVGGSPWLAGSTPIDALREDRFVQVEAAATAAIDGTPW